MPSEIDGWMEHVNFGVKGLSSHHCEAIEDAINNHDRLTEENAKLREILERLVNPENCKKDIIHIIGNAESLLNQLKEQNND